MLITEIEKHKKLPRGIFMKLAVLFVTTPSVFFVVYNLIFYYMPYFSNPNAYSNAGFEFIITMIFIDIVLISHAIFEFYHVKLKTAPLSKPKVLPAWYYLSVLPIFIVLYFVLIYIAFGSFDLQQVITKFNLFYAYTKKGFSWIFSILTMLLSVMLLDFYFNKIIWWRCIVFLICLLILGGTGGRGQIILVLFFLLYIALIVKKIRINTFVFSVMFLLAITFFISASVMRQKTDLEGYFTTNKSKLDYNQIFVLEDVIEHNFLNSTYLIDLIDIPYMFIPRYLNPEKPISTAATRELYPEKAKNGTNITFGLYANLYMNIGMLSIPFIPVLLIFWTHLYLKISAMPITTYWRFTILYFSVLPAQVIRAGLIDARMLRAYIQLLFAFAIFEILTRKYCFFRRKNNIC